MRRGGEALIGSISRSKMADEEEWLKSERKEGGKGEV